MFPRTVSKFHRVYIRESVLGITAQLSPSNPGRSFLKQKRELEEMESYL